MTSKLHISSKLNNQEHPTRGLTDQEQSFTSQLFAIAGTTRPSTNDFAIAKALIRGAMHHIRTQLGQKLVAHPEWLDEISDVRALFRWAYQLGWENADARCFLWAPDPRSEYQVALIVIPEEVEADKLN
jgi:hypothetical protein